MDYATADVTAKAGLDYTETSGTLTFGVGETEKTVSVQPAIPRPPAAAPGIPAWE